MTGAVITADLAIAQAKSSVAGIRIILVGIRIFPNIFQCRHNFKGRTRRIQSLCSPVDQYGTGIVIYQILPYFSDGIGIKSGWDTMARIFPVDTSVTIMAPR